MKTNLTLLAAALAVMLAGCATATVWQTALGPDPAGMKTDSPNGVLRVYTAKEVENNVGYEFPYTERTDYYIYDEQGHEVKGVFDNNKGEFEDRPRGVRLRPGKYTVRALAAVGLGEWVSVPVVLEAGRATEVHLNGQWKPPTDAPGDAIVHSPSGFAMGWRANDAAGAQK